MVNLIVPPRLINVFFIHLVSAQQYLMLNIIDYRVDI